MKKKVFMIIYFVTLALISATITWKLDIPGYMIKSRPCKPCGQIGK